MVQQIHGHGDDAFHVTRATDGTHRAKASLPLASLVSKDTVSFGSKARKPETMPADDRVQFSGRHRDRQDPTAEQATAQARNVFADLDAELDRLLSAGSAAD